MKIKFVFGIVFFSSISSFVFSQSKIDKEELAVLKPPTYDSTKTFEEQFKPENQYQFIGLQLFLPPVVNPEAGPVVFSKDSNGFSGNKFYTITDILQGDAIEYLKQKKLINQCGYRYKDFNSPQWKEMIVYAVFILRDNNTNETLYWVVCQSKIPPYSCSYFNSFVATPYFEKQRKTYLNRDIIYLKDKSKWVCKEVLFKKSKDNESNDSTYYTFCLLRNEKGAELQLRTPSEKLEKSFMTEKEYYWIDHANRNEREELYRSLNEKKEKHLSECISKFGKEKGEVIAQNKIEIGMTMEMCKAAWGAPWDSSKTKTLSGVNEIWFYNWKYNLHFEKGILIMIEHSN